MDTAIEFSREVYFVVHNWMTDRFVIILAFAIGVLKDG